jgi:hypothetical protein
VTPHFFRFMDGLVRLLNYPADYDEQPEDRQDDFKKFRYNVADAVVDACLVIGSDACMQARLPHAIFLFSATRALTPGAAPAAVLHGTAAAHGRRQLLLAAGDEHRTRLSSTLHCVARERTV